MKKLVTKVLAAAAVICGASTASAGIVIGGLTVPTGAHFEVASLYENVITSVGQTLYGYGEVTQINGQAISELCSGCELTYTFDSYEVTSLSATSIKFKGGVVKFYLGYGADNDLNPFAAGTPADDLVNASNGTLFLTLVGHAIDADGNTFAGSGVNIGTSSANGSGSGLLDVVTDAGSGIATDHFDTDTLTAFFGTAFADMLINSSFGNAVVPPGATCTAQAIAAGNSAGCLAGSADLRGYVIPEPASMALVGVALLAGGLTGRRRRS